MRELYHRLLSDLRKIGVDVSFDLELKPYSKTYYGRYDPNSNKVTIYVYEDKECSKLINYDRIFLTLIHEVIHCMQWQDKSFIRRRGVMHDAEFYRLLNMYSDKAKSLSLLQEVKHDRVPKVSGKEVLRVHC